LTLLRFATGKRMRQAIYIMVMIHIITTIACFVGLMAMCRPYRTNWRHFYDFPDYPQEGSCFNSTTILVLVYMLTAITSISDLVCVIIPAIIFWNSTLDRQKKIMAWILLSLGLLASIATLVRLPFAPYFSAREDRVWGLGMATLCCCLEIFLAVIAGCAPAIKPFLIAMKRRSRLVLSACKDSSLPSTGPTRHRGLNGLTDFSYNTHDLKTIHSPRGDVVEIPPMQGLNSWSLHSSPTHTIE
jgi:hypothetical protein